MKFGYYPGCSLNGTAREFSLSINEVVAALGIELEEINDWSCCGASSAHTTSHLLAVTLPARNLLLADKQGLNNILAPCAACFNRLVVSKHEITANNSLKQKTEYLLAEKINAMPEICNLIQFFQQVGLEKIKESVTKDLKDLKIACYYGCLLLRPEEIIKFDDAEDPSSMEEVVRAFGAKTVKWNFRTECCGAAHSIPHRNIVERLSKKIIDDAINSGADIIVTACPMCHSNLDMRQANILDHFPENKSIPVLYLSELAGIALGIDHKKLGLNLHTIDPMNVIGSKISQKLSAEAAL